MRPSEWERQECQFQIGRIVGTKPMLAGNGQHRLLNPERLTALDLDRKPPKCVAPVAGDSRRPKIACAVVRPLFFLPCEKQ
jgi:hypothetical protein